MKDAKKIAFALGMIVIIILLVALQIAAFAGPHPAPGTEALP